MDQKPPRPRTLQISPPAAKKSVRPSRQRRHAASRNANELKLLANNIKEIIHDLSFQRSVENPNDNVSRRSYIGIRRSATVENQQRYSRRNIVSAYYDENRKGSAVTRESGMHLLDRVSTNDRFVRGMLADQGDKTSKRQSCPWDLSYFGQHEDRSLQILASELHHLREVREKEVGELLTLNNKLQHDVFEADREISFLHQKNVTSEKRIDTMLKVYEKIRGNLKMCLGKVKELEVIGSKFSTPMNSDDETRSQRGDQKDRVSESSGFNTMSSDISECLSLGATALGYEGDGEGSVCEKSRRGYRADNDLLKDLDSLSIDSRSTGPRDDSPPNANQSDTNGACSPSPDRQLLGRLQADINSLSQINSDQSQEIERLRADLASCRKHVMSSQFQLEAVEIECSRLLAMEDQLVSVITLLKRAKQMHVHRQILGDIILDTVATSDPDDDDGGIPADVFLRNFQELLSSHPVLCSTKSDDVDRISRKSGSKIKDQQTSETKFSQKMTFAELNPAEGQEHMEPLPRASASVSGARGREDRVMFDIFESDDINNIKLDSGADDSQTGANASMSRPLKESSDVLDLLKFIDDEDQLSDTESNRSSSKRLAVD